MSLKSVQKRNENKTKVAFVTTYLGIDDQREGPATNKQKCFSSTSFYKVSSVVFALCLWSGNKTPTPLFIVTK